MGPCLPRLLPAMISITPLATSTIRLRLSQQCRPAGWLGLLVPFQRGQAIPQVADLGEERAQSGEILDLLEGAVARHRGISSHHRLGRDVAAHPGAGGNHRIRADCHMVGDANAAPEHDTIADMHASRYAYHPAYQ